MSQFIRRGFQVDGLTFPSVSAILDDLPDNQRLFSKSVSAHLSLLEPRKRSRISKANRGHKLHAAAKNYIASQDDAAVASNPDLAAFWPKLKECIDTLEIDASWNDGPLSPEHGFMKCGHRSAIWSPQHRFAGVPDLIGKVGGVNAVIEFKTCDHLYTNRQDSPSLLDQRQCFKRDLAFLQLAGYTICWQELTGETIEAAITIVSAPEDSQIMIVNDRFELESQVERFKRLAAQFHAKIDQLERESLNQAVGKLNPCLA